MVTSSSEEKNDKLLSIQKRIKDSKNLNQQVVAFVMMIFLTIIAFLVVANPGIFAHGFIVFLIMFLAIIQVIFQLYMFMHLKDEGHYFPAIFIYSGIFGAAMIVAGLIYLIWW